MVVRSTGRSKLRYSSWSRFSLGWLGLFIFRLFKVNFISQQYVLQERFNKSQGRGHLGDLVDHRSASSSVSHLRFGVSLLFLDSKWGAFDLSICILLQNAPIFKFNYNKNTRKKKKARRGSLKNKKIHILTAVLIVKFVCFPIRSMGDRVGAGRHPMYQYV